MNTSIGHRLTTCPVGLLVLAVGSGLGGGAQAAPAPGDAAPVFQKPQAITLAELGQRKVAGVSAVEVSDYAPGHYTGPLEPSPPHADLNPRRAVVILWGDHVHRFVFSHEASYCPLLELPGGEAMCNQFFEGNLGEAELFNNMGRKERNSSSGVGPR